MTPDEEVEIKALLLDIEVRKATSGRWFWFNPSGVGNTRLGRWFMSAQEALDHYIKERSRW